MILSDIENNFTGGELSPELSHRSELRAYQNGATSLRNAMVLPYGGVSWRPGLRYLATVDARRLIDFHFNREQGYALAFGELSLSVFKDGALQATVVTPWPAADLRRLYWTQSADTLLCVHPDYPPQKITRQSHTAWTIEPWAFVVDDTAPRKYSPHYKFAADDATLQASGTSGTVTLTARASSGGAGLPWFQTAHVGARFRIKNKEVEITAVPADDSITATAAVKQTLVDVLETTDWSEEVFSAMRGWPATCTFHQDRLVIGGSRDIPNRLWFSKSSEFFNFDLGTGLDDEAVDVPVNSDEVNAIVGIFSARDLQVFTTGGEWINQDDPVTPATSTLRRHSRVGSSPAAAIRPVGADGVTIFIGADNGLPRQLEWRATEESYLAPEAALFSRHLIKNPVELCRDRNGQLIHVVNEDGTLATLALYRDQEVAAWFPWDTAGAFLSLANVEGKTYALVERDGATFLEVFDGSLFVDAGVKGTSDVPTKIWAGLDHLELRDVDIVADDSVHAVQAVSTGAIRLASDAYAVQAGLHFDGEIAPMVPRYYPQQKRASGFAFRPLRSTFDFYQTRAATIDLGLGAFDVSFRVFGQSAFGAAPLFTGSKTYTQLGWRQNAFAPIWQITRPHPAPLHLKQVLTEFAFNG